MIVVDASVLVVALTDDGTDGDLARDRLRGERLAAPSIIDLEVLSVLRKLVRSSDVSPRRATLAIADLRVIPLQRAPHERLLDRCWELRENVTPYDAAYVALAEALDAPLVTADLRLSKASGIRCAVEVLAAA